MQVFSANNFARFFDDLERVRHLASAMSDYARITRMLSERRDAQFNHAFAARDTLDMLYTCEALLPRMCMKAVPLPMTPLWQTTAAFVLSASELMKTFGVLFPKFVDRRGQKMIDQISARLSAMKFHTQSAEYFKRDTAESRVCQRSLDVALRVVEEIQERNCVRDKFPRSLRQKTFKPELT